MLRFTQNDDLLTGTSQNHHGIRQLRVQQTKSSRPTRAEDCEAADNRLAGAERDSALGQIIRRQLYRNLVTRENTDVVFTHTPRNMSRNNVAIFQLDAEHGIRQGVHNGALHFDVIFFRHKSSMC